MKITPVPFTLKNGKNALLTSPEISDAGELIEYLLATSSESEYVLRYPEEIHMTLEQEERFIANVVSSDYDMMAVCRVDGRIAGNCHLMMNNRIKTSHRATVAIALYKEFWNLGIGTKMFELMIETAKAKGIGQLELEYIEGNVRGEALYKKMGFETVSFKPNAIRLKDGTLLKEYFMIKTL
ncbi:MAG: GNAT family N-acetyltransferase [Clostridia bacterium]|nr:GNAT family N-acetyltransferase [Clostridia bacterium]